MACFPVYRSLLSSRHSGMHIRGHIRSLSRVGGGVGLVRGVLGEPSDLVVPPHTQSGALRGWWVDFLLRAISRKGVPKLPLPDFLPLPSHGGPISVLWVLLERNGFVPYNWGSRVLTHCSPFSLSDERMSLLLDRSATGQ